MHLLIQVRITDQAPNQKREGEIWAWGGLGGPARRAAPPTLLKEPARLPLTGCLRPIHFEFNGEDFFLFSGGRRRRVHIFGFFFFIL